MLKKHKRKNYFIIGGVIILLIVLLYLLNEHNHYFAEPESIRGFLLRAGWLGPFALVFIEITQAVISVIPSEPFGIAAGFMYGPAYGTLITTAGISIGSCIVFLFARKYGRPFVEKHIHEEELRHFDIFFKGKGEWVILITRIIPVFPHDAVSLAMGLTKIPFTRYALLTTLSYIPGQLVLNLIGYQLRGKIIDYRIIIAIFVLIIIAAAFFFRRKLKLWIIKDIRAIEEDVKKEIDTIESGIKKEGKKTKRSLKKEIRALRKKG